MPSRDASPDTGTEHGGGPRGGVQSVERALGLLDLLARAGGRLGLSELAERSGLPLGTVHRLLATLGAAGYVRQDGDRRYALGTALMPLGDAATRLLGGWAQPFLVRLVEASGETSNLAVLEDDRVLYLAQAPGRHRMRMFTEVGKRVPPHTTAVGKVLMAWHDEVQVRRVLARLGQTARTGRSITTVPAFLAELEAVREQGWAVDDEEEEEGVRCLAVPVGPGPTAVAALSVSGPASRLQRDDPEVLAAMAAVADDLASWLGGAPRGTLSTLRK
jgi:IclR family acetate operon transcriptional repressor